MYAPARARRARSQSILQNKELAPRGQLFSRWRGLSSATVVLAPGSFSAVSSWLSLPQVRDRQRQAQGEDLRRRGQPLVPAPGPSPLRHLCITSCQPPRALGAVVHVQAKRRRQTDTRSPLATRSSIAHARAHPLRCALRLSHRLLALHTHRPGCRRPPRTSGAAALARPACLKSRLLFFTARALNARGQSWSTLSLQQEASRAANQLRPERRKGGLKPKTHALPQAACRRAYAGTCCRASSMPRWSPTSCPRSCARHSSSSACRCARSGWQSRGRG